MFLNKARHNYYELKVCVVIIEVMSCFLLADINLILYCFTLHTTDIKCENGSVITFLYVCYDQIEHESSFRTRVPLTHGEPQGATRFCSPSI